MPSLESARYLAASTTAAGVSPLYSVLYSVSAR
jgi:hypothetical protein